MDGTMASVQHLHPPRNLLPRFILPFPLRETSRENQWWTSCGSCFGYSCILLPVWCRTAGWKHLYFVNTWVLSMGLVHHKTSRKWIFLEASVQCLGPRSQALSPVTSASKAVVQNHHTSCKWATTLLSSTRSTSKIIFRERKHMILLSKKTQNFTWGIIVKINLNFEINTK